MSTKKGTMPPRYDEAFKAGAVKMVTEQGRPVKEVASELGICTDTLKSWLKRSGFQPSAVSRQNPRTAAGANLKPNFACFASSLPRKTRLLLS